MDPFKKSFGKYLIVEYIGVILTFPFLQVPKSNNCPQWTPSQAARISLTPSFPQESGLSLASTSSSMSVINQHPELMLLDLEKCSIKNLWRDRPEKAEFAQ